MNHVRLLSFFKGKQNNHSQYAGVEAQSVSAGLQVTQANFSMTMNTLAQGYQQSHTKGLALTPAYGCRFTCLSNRVVSVQRQFNVQPR
jgi:hypothetical protein